MKIQSLVLVLLIFLSSCATSALFKPGKQIITKGVLVNQKDKVNVVVLLNYTSSFEQSRNFKSKVVKGGLNKVDSIKFTTALNTFLSKELPYHQIEINPIEYNFVDSILDDIPTNSDDDIAVEIADKINEKSKILIIYARFNRYVSVDGGMYGTVGATTDFYQIISHAIILEDNSVLYHKSNFLSTFHNGNRFYRKSVSRILKDAFNK
jgi:hypothetical protein